jgi:hypothetical protein
MLSNSSVMSWSTVSFVPSGAAAGIDNADDG